MKISSTAELHESLANKNYLGLGLDISYSLDVELNLLSLCKEKLWALVINFGEVHALILRFPNLAAARFLIRVVNVANLFAQSDVRDGPAHEVIPALTALQLEKNMLMDEISCKVVFVD